MGNKQPQGLLPRGEWNAAPIPDKPIQMPAQDRYGRAEPATWIADTVASVLAGDTVVFAIQAEFGAGKSSFLHLMAHRLRARGFEVVWLNAWELAGRTPIEVHILRALGARLRHSVRDWEQAARQIEVYGVILEIAAAFAAPLAGATTLGIILGVVAKAGIAKSASALLKISRSGSVDAALDRIKGALLEAGKPLIVFLDDIDRLAPADAQALVRALHVCMRLPNISHVVPFDRAHLERALGGASGDGPALIAKAFQAPFDLPGVAPELLRREICDRVNCAVVARGPASEQTWPEVVTQVVTPLVRTPRDVVRYLNAIGPCMNQFLGQIDLGDLLALEALRVFAPDISRALRSHIDALTVRSDGSGSGGDASTIASLSNFLALTEAPKAVLQALCQLVFFAAGRRLAEGAIADADARKWRTDGRVACREILELYLNGAWPRPQP